MERTGTKQVELLAELIQESRCTVALTGAGISVPSGIPDFRSPGTGMWENVNPMEVAHIDVFRHDPKRFWSYYRPRFGMLEDKQPNSGAPSTGGARVERDARGGDHPEHRPAAPPGGVAARGRGPRHDRDRLLHPVLDDLPLEDVKSLFDTDGVARCDGCEGPVKPDVVLFGEMLPERAMEEAYELASRAELLLCVGSSLEVYPVASLPAVTAGAGGRVAIITKGPTPYDSDGNRALGRRRRRRAARIARRALSRAVALVQSHRSIEISASALVPATPEEVFEFLCDLENHWLLADRFVEVLTLDRSQNGVAGGGTVKVRGPLGLGRTATTRVVDTERPTSMTGTAELSGGTTAVVRWVLTRDDGATRVELAADLEKTRLLDRILLAAGGRRWIRHRFSSILQTLARRLT